jgi:ammonium transporter, Amt family
MPAPTLNSGDTAWVLAATGLVLFMTLPGLALFYGGLVRSKNVLSVMMHCVAIACAASVLWLVIAYSLAFHGTGAWIGDTGRVLLNGMKRDDLNGTIPESVFFMFQATFAVITPGLIVGAYVERMKFSAVLAFSALWLLLVYVPVAHWVWGGGWLAQRHVMDFAGGLVVHATAGMGALAAAWLVGPRKGHPAHNHPPHSPGMVFTGAGMLWVGWYGFNGGSALAAGADAGMALLVTHISASTAGLVWALLERLRFGRSSMVGLVTGVVAGLATITPASGFVGPLGGLIIGASAAAVCFGAVVLVKEHIKLDDSLDVFAVHGVGGILGTLMVAVLADQMFGGKGYEKGVTMADQAVTQVLGVAATVALSAVVSTLILLALKATIGLRVDPQAEQDGLDLAEHGERASPA